MLSFCTPLCSDWSCLLAPVTPAASPGSTLTPVPHWRRCARSSASSVPSKLSHPSTLSGLTWTATPSVWTAPGSGTRPYGSTCTTRRQSCSYMVSGRGRGGACQNGCHVHLLSTVTDYTERLQSLLHLCTSNNMKYMYSVCACNEAPPPHNLCTLPSCSLPCSV